MKPGRKENKSGGSTPVFEMPLPPALGPAISSDMMSVGMSRSRDSSMSSLSPREGSLTRRSSPKPTPTTSPAVSSNMSSASSNDTRRRRRDASNSPSVIADRSLAASSRPQQSPHKISRTKSSDIVPSPYTQPPMNFPSNYGFPHFSPPMHANWNLYPGMAPPSSVMMHPPPPPPPMASQHVMMPTYPLPHSPSFNFADMPPQPMPLRRDGSSDVSLKSPPSVTKKTASLREDLDSAWTPQSVSSKPGGSKNRSSQSSFPTPPVVSPSSLALVDRNQPDQAFSPPQDRVNEFEDNFDSTFRFLSPPVELPPATSAKPQSHPKASHTGSQPASTSVAEASQELRTALDNPSHSQSFESEERDIATARGVPASSLLSSQDVDSTHNLSELVSQSTPPAFSKHVPKSTSQAAPQFVSSPNLSPKIHSSSLNMAPSQPSSLIDTAGSISLPLDVGGTPLINKGQSLLEVSTDDEQLHTGTPYTEDAPLLSAPPLPPRRPQNATAPVHSSSFASSTNFGDPDSHSPTSARSHSKKASTSSHASNRQSSSRPPTGRTRSHSGSRPHTGRSERHSKSSRDRPDSSSPADSLKESHRRPKSSRSLQKDQRAPHKDVGSSAPPPLPKRKSSPGHTQNSAPISPNEPSMSSQSHEKSLPDEGELSVENDSLLPPQQGKLKHKKTQEELDRLDPLDPDWSLRWDDEDAHNAFPGDDSEDFGEILKHRQAFLEDSDNLMLHAQANFLSLMDPNADKPTQEPLPSNDDPNVLGRLQESVISARRSRAAKPGTSLRDPNHRIAPDAEPETASTHAATEALPMSESSAIPNQPPTLLETGLVPSHKPTEPERPERSPRHKIREIPSRSPAKMTRELLEETSNESVPEPSAEGQHKGNESSFGLQSRTTKDIAVDTPTLEAKSVSGVHSPALQQREISDPITTLSNDSPAVAHKQSSAAELSHKPSLSLDDAAPMYDTPGSSLTSGSDATVERIPDNANVHKDDLGMQSEMSADRHLKDESREFLSPNLPGKLLKSPDEGGKSSDEEFQDADDSVTPRMGPGAFPAPESPTDAGDTTLHAQSTSLGSLGLRNIDKGTASNERSLEGSSFNSNASQRRDHTRHSPSALTSSTDVSHTPLSSKTSLTSEHSRVGLNPRVSSKPPSDPRARSISNKDTKSSGLRLRIANGSTIGQDQVHPGLADAFNVQMIKGLAETEKSRERGPRFPANDLKLLTNARLRKAPPSELINIYSSSLASMSRQPAGFHAWLIVRGHHEQFSSSHRSELWRRMVSLKAIMNHDIIPGAPSNQASLLPHTFTDLRPNSAAVPMPKEEESRPKKPLFSLKRTSSTVKRPTISGPTNFSHVSSGATGPSLHHQNSRLQLLPELSRTVSGAARGPHPDSAHSPVYPR